MMDNFFTYKNTTIRYRIKGKGRAVVLLHGFLEDLTMWDDIAKIISIKNRVISIDLLGHGQSGNLGYIHTMEEQATMVNAILKHIKLRKYILIGHSMGGYVSLAFSELFPNTIKGLCLLNSTAVGDTPVKKKNRDRAVVAVKQNHKLFINMSIPNLFSKTNRIVFKNEIDRLILTAVNLSVQGIAASLEGMKIRKDRLTFFKKASFKKMMVIGKNDPVLDSEKLKKQSINSDIIVVEFPDGHMSFIENKVELINGLKKFIKNCN